MRREAYEAIVKPVEPKRLRRDEQHVDAQVELVSTEAERSLEVALDDVHFGELDARSHRLMLLARMGTGAGVAAVESRQHASNQAGRAHAGSLSTAAA